MKTAQQESNPLFQAFNFIVASLSSVEKAKGWRIARCTGVTDGDTVRLMPLFFGEIQTCRLEGIDTPETSGLYEMQPYGKAATKRLNQIISLSPYGLVSAKTTTTDRYGRSIVRLANLICWDINLQLVKDGAAWECTKYLRKSESKRIALIKRAHENAKRHKRGLWRDPNPVEPSIWRDKKKRRK